jgi:hypothetical protein
MRCCGSKLCMFALAVSFEVQCFEGASESHEKLQACAEVTK